MADLEEQLASVMNNPAMMEQIMALAKSMEQPQDPNPSTKNEGFTLPEIDPTMLQKLTGFAKNTGIDHNQRALLQALRPYISNYRVQRLERAMKAAKMAGFATNLLGR